MFSGSLSPAHGTSSDGRQTRQSPDMDGDSKCTELTVTDGQQGVVIQLGV